MLRPTDGRPVIKHKPGQYLTFWLEIPGHAPIKRNYSISDAPNGETYRITVKHEPQGVASGWMHEEVKPGTVLKVAPPAGEFFLAAHPERTAVLLSGGVGLTPMVSMLVSIVERHRDVPVHRSEEHTSELQSLMRLSYSFFFLKKKNEHYLVFHSSQKVRITY